VEWSDVHGSKIRWKLSDKLYPDVVELLFEPSPRVLSPSAKHKCGVWVSGAGRVYTVGLATALQTKRLQVRFPMEPLNFFIDLILPAAPWLSSRLGL
jgi:hypothetical protein